MLAPVARETDITNAAQKVTDSDDDDNDNILDGLDNSPIYPALSATCQATVLIMDQTPPSIDAAQNQVLKATSTQGAMTTFNPTTDDACGEVSVAVTPMLDYYPFDATEVIAQPFK